MAYDLKLNFDDFTTLSNLPHQFGTPSLSSAFYTSDFHNYYSETMEDGKHRLVVLVAGHSPENVSVDVCDNRIEIKTNTETTDKFVKNIKLSFKVGESYDVNTAAAEIKNGILTIVLDKREAKKPKKLKISF